MAPRWYFMPLLFLMSGKLIGAKAYPFFFLMHMNSDNLPVVRHAKSNPNLTASQRQQVQERWRNQVSAVSTTFSNIGFLVTSGVLSAVSFVNWEGRYAFPDGVTHTLGNAPVYNYISTVVCACFWAVNALPYFLITPRGRRGPPLPADANYFTFGWKSIILALKEARKLRYLFMYIFAYFMFSDAVSTISQMTGIIQGELTGFSAQQNAIFSFISAVTSILGCLFFLWLSKTFRIRTKTSLLMIVVLTSVVPVWGCFGIGLDNFGIKVSMRIAIKRRKTLLIIHTTDALGIVGAECVVRSIYSAHLGLAANHVGRISAQGKRKLIFWIVWCSQ